MDRKRSEHKVSRLNAACSLSFLSDSLFELSRPVSVSYRADGDSNDCSIDERATGKNSQRIVYIRSHPREFFRV